MNLKRAGRSYCAAALMVVASASASAGVVLDGWQMVTPTGFTTTIGHLNLTTGTSTYVQQVNGSGQAFVGAQFSETGSILSASFNPENTVGGGDTGAASGLSDLLTISFSNVMGTITALNAGGGFHFVYDSGTFTVSGIMGNYASGSIAGLGGDVSSTAVFGAFTRDTNLFASIDSILNLSFDLRDSNGISLKPMLATDDVMFEAVTKGHVTSISSVAKCSFNADAVCVYANLAATGEGYLVGADAPTDVPEPHSLALLGIALLGLGAARRRPRN